MSNTANLLPIIDHQPRYVGQLGKEFDDDSGQDTAYSPALSVLAVARKHMGLLNRVSRVVRLGLFIATSGDFFDQPGSRTLCRICFELCLILRRYWFGW